MRLTASRADIPRPRSGRDTTPSFFVSSPPFFTVMLNATKRCLLYLARLAVPKQSNTSLLAKLPHCRSIHTKYSCSCIVEKRELRSHKDEILHKKVHLVVPDGPHLSGMLFANALGPVSTVLMLAGNRSDTNYPSRPDALDGLSYRLSKCLWAWTVGTMRADGGCGHLLVNVTFLRP